MRIDIFAAGQHLPGYRACTDAVDAMYVIILHRQRDLRYFMDVFAGFKSLVVVIGKAERCFRRKPAFNRRAGKQRDAGDDRVFGMPEGIVVGKLSDLSGHRKTVHVRFVVQIALTHHADHLLFERVCAVFVFNIRDCVVLGAAAFPKVQIADQNPFPCQTEVEHDRIFKHTHQRHDRQ